MESQLLTFFVALTAIAVMTQAVVLVAIYMVDRAALHLADGRADLAVPLLQDALRIRVRAGGVVPSRRRMRAEIGWSVEATQLLLEQAMLANARVAFARTVPIS